MDFLAARRQRLTELRCQRPEFDEIFAICEQLYAALAQHTRPVLACPDAGSSQRPLLQGDNLEISAEEGAQLLRTLLGVLQHHGRQGQQELQQLESALNDAQLDVAFLLRAYIQRDRYPIVHTAIAAKVEPALLEYLLGLACSFTLQQLRHAGLRLPESDIPRSGCPLCGGAPGMGELRGDTQSLRLHCATCGQSFVGSPDQCGSCGNRERTTLEVFTVGEDPEYRVHACRACYSYLKVIDRRRGGETPCMDLEDLATLHFDLVAQRAGFTKGKQPRAQQTAT